MASTEEKHDAEADADRARGADRRACAASGLAGQASTRRRERCLTSKGRPFDPPASRVRLQSLQAGSPPAHPARHGEWTLESKTFPPRDPSASEWPSRSCVSEGGDSIWDARQPWRGSQQCEARSSVFDVKKKCDFHQRSIKSQKMIAFTTSPSLARVPWAGPQCPGIRVAEQNAGPGSRRRPAGDCLSVHCSASRSNLNGAPPDPAQSPTRISRRAG